MILAIKTATGIVGTVESVVSGQRTQTKQVGGQRLSHQIHKKVRIPTFSPLLPHQTRQSKTEFSFAPEAAYLGVPVDSKAGPSLNLEGHTDISYGVGSPAMWYPPHSQGQSLPRVPQGRPDNLEAVLSSHPRNRHLFSKSSELINLQYMFRDGAPQGKENPAQG